MAWNGIGATLEPWATYVAHVLQIAVQVKNDAPGPTAFQFRQPVRAELQGELVSMAHHYEHIVGHVQQESNVPVLCVPSLGNGPAVPVGLYHA